MPTTKTKKTPDASHVDKRRIALIAAAALVGFVIVKKLRGGGSTSGATVPVADTLPTDTTLGGGGAVGGDSSLSSSPTDLATALQPFADQLDNLQTQADANSALITTLLPDSSTDTLNKPLYSVAGVEITKTKDTAHPFATLAVGPNLASDASPAGFANVNPVGYAAPASSDPFGAAALGAMWARLATPRPLTLAAAPQVASTPNGAAVIVPQRAPEPAAPVPTAPPAPAARATVGKRVAG